MKFFLSLSTLLTLPTAARGMQLESSPLCMSKCPDSEPVMNGPCFPEEISNCNCVYDDSDCYRCSAERGDGIGGNWTLKCSGVPRLDYDYEFEEYEVDASHHPDYTSTLTMAYGLTPEEEQDAEEEAAMMLMAMNDQRALHYALPTNFPTSQPSVCDSSGCAEMECCGMYSSWDTDILMCTVAAASSGWDGLTRPHHYNFCHERDCQDEFCCGAGLSYDYTESNCTWDPEAWAMDDMVHYLEHHYNGNMNCADMCHESEDHCDSMCDFLGLPSDQCIDACLNAHYSCHDYCGAPPS